MIELVMESFISAEIPGLLQISTYKKRSSKTTRVNKPIIIPIFFSLSFSLSIASSPYLSDYPQDYENDH